ncbi:MAG: hypothetical protein DWI22_15965 [Planctomycetota bacterium]|nr:MAG: hypothetical protein DWI22_15965 [Planctomycetota bacterium]
MIFSYACAIRRQSPAAEPARGSEAPVALPTGVCPAAVFQGGNWSTRNGQGGFLRSGRNGLRIFKTGEFWRKFPRCCKPSILVSLSPLSAAVYAETGIELLRNQQHTTSRNSPSRGAFLNEQPSARS